MSISKSSFYVYIALVSIGVNAADGGSSNPDSRLLGAWKGSWLEGMSSGKVVLQLNETSGELSFTALPSFGAEPAPITKIVGHEKQLGFVAAGKDGRVMRFDLKPSSDYRKLKGKSYYDSLHMELELSRAP